MDIILLTGNQRKRESFQAIVNELLPNLTVEIQNPWLPEIQANDTAEVARFAARYGADTLGQPVVKMDSGFYIEALAGFPGALVRSAAEKIGAERFFSLIDGISDRRAWLANSLAYCEPGQEPVVFTATTDGEVVTSYQSLSLSFIDELFVPHRAINPAGRSMGEIRLSSPERIITLWGDAERQFAVWYKNNRG